jgi:hypothetical protein
VPLFESSKLFSRHFVLVALLMDDYDTSDGYDLLDPRAGQLWLWKKPSKPLNKITGRAPMQRRYFNVSRLPQTIAAFNSHDFTSTTMLVSLYYICGTLVTFLTIWCLLARFSPYRMLG